ncbi:alpha/beta fold hydrolase [Streptomyces sp. NPDC007088]|uniref:alpha/beta fold hydrolase n=1 Tax=Streptomyces sp. NPDC007088 TaxID=3364773 RepID=UPI0036C4255C
MNQHPADQPRTLRAHGITLAYRVAGPEDAPPLLLLHARGESGTDWRPVLGALADRRRVYALDLRGHGASTWPGEYSYELMRDDVYAFLGALGLTRVDVLAHSMGGLVACLLAQDRPRLMRSLVLEDVPAPLPLDPPRPPPARPEGPLSFDWRMVLATERPRNLPDPAWWRRMDRIDLPVLMIAGGPDSVVDQASVAALAERIPGARLVTVDAGHLVHATRPETFLAHVLPFLDAPGARVRPSAREEDAPRHGPFGSPLPGPR